MSTFVEVSTQPKKTARIFLLRTRFSEKTIDSNPVKLQRKNTLCTTMYLNIRNVCIFIYYTNGIVVHDTNLAVNRIPSIYSYQIANGDYIPGQSDNRKHFFCVYSHNNSTKRSDLRLPFLIQYLNPHLLIMIKLLSKTSGPSCHPSFAQSPLIVKPDPPQKKQPPRTNANHHLLTPTEDENVTSSRISSPTP